LTVVFVWLTEPSPRLALAQEELEKSIRAFGHAPLRYPAGKKLVLFGDVLALGRSGCRDDAFVWCNSDVLLTRDPSEVPDPSRVYGFHRREVPGGRFAPGVDMYRIPVAAWDGILSRDIPPLYLGASYVDWWISRAMQKAGFYDNLTGYIDHRSHSKSSAASNGADRHYQANFSSYNSWARRNGLDPIPAPPYFVPGLGHVWGLRDTLRKAAGILKSRRLLDQGRTRV